MKRWKGQYATAGSRPKPAPRHQDDELRAARRRQADDLAAWEALQERRRLRLQDAQDATDDQDAQR